MSDANTLADAAYKDLLDGERITITLEKYNDLLDDANFLQCLRNAGVDNWDGYEFALEEYHGE